MNWYRVRKGMQSFLPKKFKLYGRFNTMIWSAGVTESMKFDYIDPNTGKVDNDWMDWKKVGGISLVNWRRPMNVFVKNRDAIMLAWRWNVELRVFEFCLYVNEDGENLPYERADQVLRLWPEQINGVDLYRDVHLKIDRMDAKTYRCLLTDGSNSDNINTIVVKTKERFTHYSHINPWYGGANNSEGIWGGAAPKDMEIKIGFFVQN